MLHSWQIKAKLETGQDVNVTISKIRFYLFLLAAASRSSKNLLVRLKDRMYSSCTAATMDTGVVDLAGEHLSSDCNARSL